MSTYKFPGDKFNIFWTGKETAYRTNADGKDADIVTAANIYQLPMVDRRQLIKFPQRTKTYDVATGKVDYGIAYHGKYEPTRISLGGPMQDMSMMYFMTGECVTGGDGTPYTHTYTSTNDRADPVPSFQMYLEQDNANATYNYRKALVGCFVKDWNLSWSAYNPTPILNINIEAAKHITQAGALTANDEAYKNVQSYPNVDDGAAGASYLKKATVAYDCVLTSFSLSFTNNSKGFYGNDQYFSDVYYGHREIKARIGLLMKKTDFFDDLTGLEPGVANDLDLTVRLYRTVTDDEILFTFSNLWPANVPEPTYQDDMYVHIEPEFILDPYTASSLVIVESNLFNNDRYANES